VVRTTEPAKAFNAGDAYLRPARHKSSQKLKAKIMRKIFKINRIFGKINFLWIILAIALKLVGEFVFLQKLTLYHRYRIVIIKFYIFFEIRVPYLFLQYITSR